MQFTILLKVLRVILGSLKLVGVRYKKQKTPRFEFQSKQRFGALELQIYLTSRQEDQLCLQLKQDLAKASLANCKTILAENALIAGVFGYYECGHFINLSKDGAWDILSQYPVHALNLPESILQKLVKLEIISIGNIKLEAIIKLDASEQSLIWQRLASCNSPLTHKKIRP